MDKMEQCESRKRLAAGCGDVHAVADPIVTWDESEGKLPTEEQFIRFFWEELINHRMSGEWIDDIFECAAEEFPAQVTVQSAEALERMLRRGVQREDLCLVARSLFAEGAFWMLQRLAYPGVEVEPDLTDAGNDDEGGEPDYISLSELILEGGPEDVDGNPGGWPVV